jgi:hypothetical protein
LLITSKITLAQNKKLRCFTIFQHNLVVSIFALLATPSVRRSRVTAVEYLAAAIKPNYVRLP